MCVGLGIGSRGLTKKAAPRLREFAPQSEGNHATKTGTLFVKAIFFYFCWTEKQYGFTSFV